MNYSESITYIESLMPTLERPTLARMRAFAEENGNFQNTLPCFHVGGTNGKGSTVAILDAVLRSTGRSVGRFTGPHIMRFNERFCLNGRTIDDQRFAEIATIAHDRSLQFAARHPDLGPLTWFEFLTAMAFFYFNQEKVDVCVLEVGLGGRFDATNIVDNVLGTIITNIDLDHTQFLGDTREKIAFEKAGIMRKDVPAITGAVEPALSVLKSEAAKAGTTLINIDERANAELDKEIEEAVEHLSLAGPHQKRNAKLALTSFQLSPLATDLPLATLKESLGSIYFAGRMQFVNDKNLIMDGAHNPAGAAILRKALGEEKSHCFILGFFANKDVDGYLKCLLRKGDHVVAVEAGGRRASFDRDEIVRLCREMGVEAKSANSMESAYTLACQLCNDKTAIIATGSFGVVRECMQFLGWQSVEDGQPETTMHTPSRTQMG